MAAQDACLGLQVYVEAPDLAAGLDAARALARRLEPVARVLSCEVSPYWKIPEYQGVWMRIAAPDLVAAFDAVSAALAADWDLHCEGEERWAVWNHDRNGPGALPALRWMNLEPLPAPEP